MKRSICAFFLIVLWLTICGFGGRGISGAGGSGTGTGDFMADGSVPMTAALPAAKGVAVGNGTSPGYIQLLEGSGNGSDYSSITGVADAGSYPAFTFGGSQGSQTAYLQAANALWTWNTGASGATWAFTEQVTFTSNPRIYDGSHYLTLDADGLTGDATITFGKNTNNLYINNGTAVLDIAAAATLNIDTSLQIATGAVVINGNAGGSSVLTLPNQTTVIGTLTDGKWCSYASSGTTLSCTQDAPAGSGDVTDVGNCSGGNCLDGSSDGGTQILFYDAQGATTLAVGDNAGAVTVTLPTATGTLALLDSPTFTTTMGLPAALTNAAATTWTALDNNASAFSIGSTGKADILKVVTTDSSEGVTMSGTLTVTGAFTAASLGTTASASPTILMNDSDAPGADKEIGKIVGAYIDGADGSENGTVSIYAHEAGTTTEYIQADGKNVRVDLLKPVYAASTITVGGQLNLMTTDADPGTTAGGIKHDSSSTESQTTARGVLKWFDGTSVRTIADIGTDSTIITKTEYLPIRYAEDGTTAPSAVAEVSTTTAVARSFTEGDDVVFWWIVPNDYVGGIKYRVFYALSADASADETVIYSMTGCIAANSAALGCSAGTALTITDELGTDDDQYQVMITDYSAESNADWSLTAGGLAKLAFSNAAAGDLASGEPLVIGIEIKYKAKLVGFAGY